MNEPQRATEEQVIRFLEGEMSVAEAVEFEKRLSEPRVKELVHKHLADSLEDKTIEESLRKQFQPATPTVAEVERWLEPIAAAPSRHDGTRAALAAAVLAAVVVGVLLSGNWFRPNKVRPFFQSRALAEIYVETVEQGFKPYYLCDDEERFASTFKKRQDVALRLAQPPPKRSMAGLSYLGGLSRDTTAMLCFVEQQPVLVFVDRKFNAEKAITTVPEGKSLFVHQSELDDLVLFEVSPFAEPKMMQFLQVVR